MSSSPAYTTHSFMGFNMLRQGKSQYLAAVRSPESADLVIVEEISMLPLAVWNKLYTELLDGNIKTLLLLGDPIQLPAVGIGVTIEEIKSKQAVIIELSDQMRQDASNTALLSYFDLFRKAIATKDYKFDPFNAMPPCINLITDHKEFASLYKQSTSQKKLLAYSNSVVDKYNQYINGYAFHVGDEVIIDKPLGTCKNGETVLILAISEKDDRYVLDVSAKGTIFTILTFKTKSALASYLETDSDEEYWERSDKCYNLKQQYSCTVHKAQGSTYQSVFIDVADIKAQLTKKPSVHNNYARPIAYNTYLRLLYVAISRMQESAYLYIGDSRNYKSFKGA